MILRSGKPNADDNGRWRAATNKIMNHSLHFYLRFALAAGLLLVWPRAGQAQFTYTTAAGAVTITGYTGTNATVIIPSTTNGYPVKNIGNNAFYKKATITSVSIPDSVTNIGTSAFQQCVGLASVNLGNGVNTIGDYAFEYCGSLTSLPLPSSVSKLGTYAFAYATNLASVNLSTGVTSIGTYAFYNCLSLTSVTIPSSVTNLGASAFRNCFFLSTAYFQGNAPLVGTGAGSADRTVFYGQIVLYDYIEGGVVYYQPGTTGWGATYGSWPTVCLTNTTPLAAFTYVTNNGGINITGYVGTNLDVILPASINGYPVTAIGDNAFSSNLRLRSVLLPNSVTSIGNQAFYNCRNLLSLPLPDNLTSIGIQAFSQSAGLTYVTIPSGVTNIGSGAFMACYSLLNISVAASNLNYASLGGVLFDSTLTTLIQSPAALGGNYVVPNSVTNISGGAFYTFNSGVTNVTIPNSVLNIDATAFIHSYSLKSIVVAADNPNYTSVGGVLFNKAVTTLLQCPGGFPGNYAITNSVNQIGAGAFSYGSGLLSVTIPDSVTNIGSSAFFWRFTLKNITVSAANPNYMSVAGVLFNKAGTLLIQYPIGLAGDYLVPNGVTTIGDDAFNDNQVLTNLTIPDSVTCIGNRAFSYCNGLTGLAFGNHVYSIGDSAFYSCSSLPSVTIPNSVTNLSYSAFAYCTKLHLAYFLGNAPTVNGGAGSADTTSFLGETGTVFYQPGTTGWASTFGGWPTVPEAYQPQPQLLGAGTSGPSNSYNFTIAWATNAAVVVEASTNLQTWTPLSTNTLGNGSNTFTDADWTNWPQRFYRVRKP